MGPVKADEAKMSEYKEVRAGNFAGLGGAGLGRALEP